MIQLEYEQLIEQVVKNPQSSNISKIISKISESTCPPSTNCNAIGCKLCWAHWLSDEVKSCKKVNNDSVVLNIVTDIYVGHKF